LREWGWPACYNLRNDCAASQEFYE
jgi:hypothetical protein